MPCEALSESQTTIVMVVRWTLDLFAFAIMAGGLVLALRVKKLKTSNLALLSSSLPLMGLAIVEFSQSVARMTAIGSQRADTIMGCALGAFGVVLSAGYIFVFVWRATRPTLV